MIEINDDNSQTFGSPTRDPMDFEFDWWGLDGGWPWSHKQASQSADEIEACPAATCLNIGVLQGQLECGIWEKPWFFLAGGRSKSRPPGNPQKPLI